MTTNGITIGAQVKRKSGPAHKGMVLALREGQAQVRWQAGARTGGGEFLPTVWTALDSIKLAGTSTTAHQGWCKAQGETVRLLIKQALALRGGGSLALAEGLNVDLSRVRFGKVRARVEYETAIEALRSAVTIS